MVIIPVTPSEQTRPQVIDYCLELKQQLQDRNYMDGPVRVEFDDRDMRGGEKAWAGSRRVSPPRRGGPRDMEAGTVFVGRRDRGVKDKQSMPVKEFVVGIANLLDEMQAGLLAKAKAFQQEHTREITTEADFVEFLRQRTSTRPKYTVVSLRWDSVATLNSKIRSPKNIK